VVAISGGKDSTAMALRLRELYPSRAFSFVITITGDELPPMLAHWADLESRLGSAFIRLYCTAGREPIGLLDLIRAERMIPNFRARFCTRMLKIEPFFTYLGSLVGPSAWYSGLRADEETRGGIIHELPEVSIIYPLQDWGWGLADVEQYLAEVGVVIPARTDCGACFFQRLPEWKALLLEYPDRYAEYEAIEAEIGYTFRSDRRDTWPAGLKELRLAFESGRPLRNWSRKRKELHCSWCAR